MIDSDFTDHYAALGVAEGATLEEIKAVYFASVRRHRPDTQPEQFRRLHLSYRILSHPTRRREYDQMRRYGDEVRHRIHDAEPLLDSDPRRAVRLLKEALVMVPEAFEIRLMIGRAFLRCEEYQNAEMELKRLITKRPQQASLYHDLAYCLWMQKRENEAIHALEKAIELNPLFHDALLLAAHIHQAQRNYALATQHLEAAIRLDNVEDLHDIPVLIRLFTLAVIENDVEKTSGIEARLRGVIPFDELVATEVMNRLLVLANDFFENRNYKGAYDVVRRIHHPLLRDREFQDGIGAATTQMACAAQVAEMVQDDRILGMLQMYLCNRYWRSPRPDDGQNNTHLTVQRQQVLQEAQQNPGPYRLMLARIATNYPLIRESESALLHQVESLTEQQAIEIQEKNEEIMPAAFEPKTTPLHTARRWFSGQFAPKPSKST